MKIKFDVVWEVWICSRKPENHQTFEGLSIKFLSIMCHFGNFNEYILKIEYLYKILKNMQHINSNFQTRSLPWESGEFACVGFCEWVQNGIDACISHRIYQPSLLSMIFSSLRCCHSSKKPTFCLNQLRKSPASKVKSRQASCKIISLQTSLQIIAKRFLKLPNLLLIKWKSPSLPKNLALRTFGLLLGLLFNNLEVLSSTSDQSKLFPK